MITIETHKEQQYRNNARRGSLESNRPGAEAIAAFRRKAYPTYSTLEYLKKVGVIADGQEEIKTAQSIIERKG